MHFKQYSQIFFSKLSRLRLGVRQSSAAMESCIRKRRSSAAVQNAIRDTLALPDS